MANMFEQLDRPGLACFDSEIITPKEEASPSSPPPGGVLGSYTGPVASATGLCVLEGAPDIEGQD